MASILASILGISQTRFLNQTYGVPELTNVKVKSARITLRSEPMRNKLENGSTYIDSRVILPVSIEMEAIAPDINTAEQLHNSLQERSSLFEVTSRGLIVPNMMMKAQIMKQGPEMLSAIPVKLILDQLMIQGEYPVVFKNEADSRLVNIGNRLVEAVTDTAQNLFDKVSQYF